ncbi:MAG: APC family permease [Candidatus Acidiferrum sp.]
MSSTPDNSAAAGSRGNGIPRVIVATTALLTFISFWRAAAIVLNDMGSSAFYAGAIAEGFIGKTAPWFILAVMLLSYAVRAVYIESCSLFVRGGVYRVVKEAMGGTLAKVSVSALMFDYILTGPISGVSAGLYLIGLLNELFPFAHLHIVIPMNGGAAVFAVVITLYFWWENIKGIPESSGKALRIMYITSVMVVLLISWCIYTLYVRGAHLPPWPHVSNLVYSTGAYGGALGWLHKSSLPYTVGLIGILIGLGHSVLAMSGEETMAQVYRELEHPKLRNLEKAGFIIFIYSLIFTAGVAFFSVMIVPDAVRANFLDNPIGGLAMYLVGPFSVRLIFRAFVAVVGVLMLAGAVNTAIVGSNGVLNRVSEDGILPEWFRRPHRRFGTSHRTLNLVAGLQIFTIILSRGDIFILGEAYAFGVMWSFAMNGLAVLLLRYKRPGQQEFKVPLNFRIGGTEIPLGLGLITLTLFALCGINLFTKEIATISGVIFTFLFFVAFVISEKITRRRAAMNPQLDQFNLQLQGELTPEAVDARPGNILVPISNHFNLYHLGNVLDRIKPGRRDVVVLHVRLLRRSASGEHELDADQLFGSIEQHLFSQALSMSEKRGKSIRLAVVASNDLWEGILRAGASLQSSTIVIGRSSKDNTEEQARLIGDAWEKLGDIKPQFNLEIHLPNGDKIYKVLGPHAPNLTANEVNLLHRLWLRFSDVLAPQELHHHDVVHFALEEVKKEIEEGQEDAVVTRLREHLRANQFKKPPSS